MVGCLSVIFWWGFSKDLGNNEDDTLPKKGRNLGYVSSSLRLMVRPFSLYVTGNLVLSEVP